MSGKQALRALGWLALLAHPGLLVCFAVGVLADARDGLPFFLAVFGCLALIFGAVLAAIIYSNLHPPTTELERRQAQQMLSWAATLSTAFYLIGLPSGRRA